MAVASARADEAPTPAHLLAEHLGPEAPSLPVVGEGWATYEHVNLQGALERWTQASGRSSCARYLRRTVGSFSSTACASINACWRPKWTNARSGARSAG